MTYSNKLKFVVSETQIKLLGDKLDSLVHLAKTVGKYVNSEAGGDERKVMWEQLNYEYEDFCEWRHEEPFREHSMSEILESIISEIKRNSSEG